MSPQTLDWILAAIVLLFVLNGFYQGLIHMLGSIVGLVIGIGVASRFDAAVGSWIAGATGWNKDICVIIGFVLVLLAFTRVFGFVLDLLEKTFKFMKIPLIGLANRVSGGTLGFFEGVLVVGATLIIIKTLPFPVLVKTISISSLAGSLMAAAALLLPLLPKSIRDLYSVSNLK
jgi:uncharacterized membrane protein required for colicin V production